MEEVAQINARVVFLTRRVDELRTLESELPYGRDDWRKVKRELRHAEEALAQAKREAELAVDWDAAWSCLAEIEDEPLRLTAEEERSLNKALREAGARVRRDEKARERRAAFYVIEGGRGVGRG